MNLFSKAIEPDYNTLVKQGAMIVDVRTPGEFRAVISADPSIYPWIRSGIRQLN